MRTLPLAALLAAALATPAAAQFGLKGGPSFATRSTSNTVEGVAPDFSTSTGLAVGLSLAFPSGSQIQLQPEALYVQTNTTDLEVGYVQFPLTLKLSLGRGGIRPYLFGGGYIGFQVSCDGSEDIGDCETGSHFQLKQHDYGVPLGLGLRFGGGPALFAEIRYHLGLTDINDIDAGFDAKNRVVLLMGGIEF